MIHYSNFRHVFVLVLIFCAVGKVVAQTVPLDEEITTRKIKTHNLSRVQRSVRKPIQQAQPRLNYNDGPRMIKEDTKAQNILNDGFVRLTYHAMQAPIIKTVPFQETVIHLEPGEEYINISSGDPSRWSYAVATSGAELAQQQHVLVKPSLPSIQTNLVITTNKRIYQFQLESVLDQPITRAVIFRYPQSPVNHLVNPNKDADKLKEARVVNSNYQIFKTGLYGKEPTWRPIKVVDDGIKTYISFSSGISQTDLPVLSILQNGQKELVNYRFKDHQFIVDKVFENALLVSGVGNDEISVMIKRIVT